MYVEIKVTHGVSQEKLDTKNKIIEISISSEENIQKIKTKRLPVISLCHFLPYNLSYILDNSFLYFPLFLFIHTFYHILLIYALPKIQCQKRGCRKMLDAQALLDGISSKINQKQPVRKSRVLIQNDKLLEEKKAVLEKAHILETKPEKNSV